MVQPKDHDFQKSPPPTAPPSYGQPPPPPPPQPQYYSQPTAPPSYGQPPPPPPSQNYSQPPATGIPIQHGNLQGQWSTGICDCFDDVSNCCLTFWCPCITFGRVAEIVDRGSTSCGASGALYTLIAWATGCACIYSCLYREKMRKLYLLPGNKCTDCLLHSFCEQCALCQEHRELQNHGFDMALGWHGNAERQNHGVTMAPFVQGGMNR